MNKEKIIVLGGGLVGGPMAMDLALENRFDVTVADLNESALAELQARQPRISVLVEDLSTRATVKDVVDGYDIVAAQPRLCRAKTRPAPPPTWKVGPEKPGATQPMGGTRMRSLEWSGSFEKNL